MAARRVARARRRSVLPADMVDEYLTFDCKTLSKLEKRMNAASCDGYLIQGTIKQYNKPETETYYPMTRFWAVMTKRVNPDNLVMALVDSELLDKPVAIGRADVERTSTAPQTSSGGDPGPPAAAPNQIVKREKIYHGK